MYKLWPHDDVTENRYSKCSNKFVPCLAMVLIAKMPHAWNYGSLDRQTFMTIQSRAMDSGIIDSENGYWQL